jgi:hypothetical protein
MLVAKGRPGASLRDGPSQQYNTRRQGCLGGTT